MSTTETIKKRPDGFRDELSMYIYIYIYICIYDIHIHTYHTARFYVLVQRSVVLV